MQLVSNDESMDQELDSKHHAHIPEPLPHKFLPLRARNAGIAMLDDGDKPKNSEVVCYKGGCCKEHVL